MRCVVEDRVGARVTLRRFESAGFVAQLSDATRRLALSTSVSVGQTRARKKRWTSAEEADRCGVAISCGALNVALVCDSDVGREPEGDLESQGVGEAGEREDGGIAAAVLDAADLALADVGGGGELLLREAQGAPALQHLTRQPVAAAEQGELPLGRRAGLGRFDLDAAHILLESHFDILSARPLSAITHIKTSMVRCRWTRHGRATAVSRPVSASVVRQPSACELDLLRLVASGRADDFVVAAEHQDLVIAVWMEEQPQEGASGPS